MENNGLIRGDSILLAVSRGLDIIEGEVIGAPSGHNKRVAAISTGIGRALGMGGDELITLSACALLHDSALTEWLESGEGSGEHCVMGQRNIDTLPLPADPAGIVLYHHERADGTGLLGAREFPVSAEIISFADAYDLGLPLSGYSGNILDAFDNVNLAETSLPVWNLPLPEAMKFGGIITKAIDYKSKFTRRHSLGITEKALKMAEFYVYGKEETAKLYLAACLHDLGKLAIPAEILEKPGSLTRDEFLIIKEHVRQTHEMLEGVDPDIRRWASGHHEKLDGSGYPFGLKAAELDFNSRLMTCVDIYQAVSEERPYHSARSHGETISIMRQIAEQGGIDWSIVRDLDMVLAE